MAPMTDAADPSPFITPLWERARAMLARVLAVFGGSAAIAAIALLTPRLRRDIVARIAPLEHVVRKLLFVEAAKYAHLAATGAPRRGFPHASDAAARPALDLSQPETWPARFALAPPRDPLLVPDARAPRIRSFEPFPVIRPPRESRRTRRAQAPAQPAFKLARRLEALRRVLSKPAPHARRLARHFARVRRRYPEAPSRYAAAPSRTGAYDPDDPRLGLECHGCAFAAASAFADSS